MSFLNKDTISMILNHLDVLDYFALSRINKTWREAFLNIRKNEREIFEIIKNYIKNVHKMKLYSEIPQWKKDEGSFYKRYSDWKLTGEEKIFMSMIDYYISDGAQIPEPSYYSKELKVAENMPICLIETNHKDFKNDSFKLNVVSNIHISRCGGGYFSCSYGPEYHSRVLFNILCGRKQFDHYKKRDITSITILDWWYLNNNPKSFKEIIQEFFKEL